MKHNHTAAATGLAAAALAAFATLGIGLADQALADDSGTVAIPGPMVVYPQDSRIGGANPYLPFGPNPMAPYGTWTP